MSNTIKLARAQRAAIIGNNPGTYVAILRHLPKSAVAKLSGRELGELVDALYACSREGQRLALHAACDEGAVWDERCQHLRPLAAPEAHASA